MRASKIAAVAYAVGMVAYPVGVYLAFTRLSPAAAAGLLAAVLVPAAILRSRRPAATREGEHVPSPLRALAPLAFLPLVTAGLLLIAAALGSAAPALLVPVAVNAGLLLAFGSTLWRGPPMIERFARMQVDDLDEAELRWCRGWTWGWSLFFVLNGGTALVLALRANLEAWTTYNGLVAYTLIGMLFGVEYVVRKHRFGRLGEHLLDRLLRRLFTALRRGATP